MKRLFISVSFILLLSGGLVAQELKRAGIVAPSGFNYEPDTISILSWNVEHFVDLNDDPYVNNNRENSPQERMGNKEELLVKALKKVDADIVVLQEFESSSYLRDIARRHLEGMGYQFFAGNESDGWYMNVVIMSKVPLGVFYSYGSLYTPVPGIKGDDGLEETQVNLNTRMWSIDVLPNANYDFNLTGVHLKAGRGERNEQMRIGQIQLLKNQFARFIKENKKANLVIMGDFNAYPDSKEMAAFLEGKRGLKFVDPLPASVLSHPSRGPERRLDYMIPNINMTKELVTGSVTIPYILSKSEMETLSDHLPVIGKFIVKEQ